jgi:hypothetical protein
MLFLKERFPNAQISNIDIHLDQSTPHLHIMSRYLGNHSLQEDLDKLYSKKRFQYSDMQIDFNQFVKNNFDFTTFNELKIEDITRGGKRDYTPLAEYKQANSEITQMVQKEINTILDNTKVIAKWFGENMIKKSDYHNMLIEFCDVKKELYFLRSLSNKTQIHKELEILKQNANYLKEEVRQLKANNTLLQRDRETVKKLFGEDISLLSDDEYFKKIEQRENTITNLKRQNQKLQNIFKESTLKSKKDENTIETLSSKINTLKKDIALKDGYISGLINIITKSREKSIHSLLKKLGDTFVSFKKKLISLKSKKKDPASPNQFIR